MSGDLIEEYILLSLEEELKAQSITTLLQVQGYRSPASDSEQEWLNLDLLKIPRMRTRRKRYRTPVVFQVTCVSRLGLIRTNKRTSIPWNLAGQVARFFEHKNLEVKEYGTSAEAKIAILKITEPASSYMTEEDGLAEAPGSGLHYVVLTFTGLLSMQIV